MKTKEQLDELIANVKQAKNTLLFDLARNDGYIGNQMNERYKDNETYQLGYQEGSEWRNEEYKKYNNLTL
jgi:hypothetical protein